MTHDEAEKVLRCQRPSCVELLDQGMVARGSGGDITEVICHECARKDKLKMWRETGIITSSLLLVANAVVSGSVSARVASDMDDYWKLDRMNDTLGGCAKLFEQVAYFGNLQKQIQDEKHYSGMSADLSDGFKLLTFCTAGRIMFTISKGDDSITFITTDEPGQNSRMGVQGVHGTFNSLCHLVVGAIPLAAKAKLAVDRGVGLG